MNQDKKPQYPFDWGVYVDATSAGLSVLIPIPIIDWLFEQFFRRRMLTVIAKRREQTLSPAVKKEFNRGEEQSWWLTCLFLPVILIFWLLKRISKKILYFLTVKEAADQLSLYWHQAFLIDQMLQQGHLQDEQSAQMARLAMWKVINNTPIGPLHHLARQIVRSPKRVARAIGRLRRRKAVEATEDKPTDLDQNWDTYREYFAVVAGLYAQAYRANVVQAEAERVEQEKQLALQQAENIINNG